ncbi:unnamed protein product, partial [Trichogramma brassicae]
TTSSSHKSTNTVDATIIDDFWKNPYTSNNVAIVRASFRSSSYTLFSRGARRRPERPTPGAVSISS